MHTHAFFDKHMYIKYIHACCYEILHASNIEHNSWWQQSKTMISQFKVTLVNPYLSKS